jgi:predicted component of type VI protein secretion system
MCANFCNFPAAFIFCAGCSSLSLYPSQAAVQVYHAPGINPSQLAAQAEEVVEVLSCYFPVAFTPPKNDPFK